MPDELRRLAVPLIVALGLPACAADQPVGSGAWTAATAWSVADQPRLQIGVVDGAPEEQFTRVMSAFRTQDGRIVVANFDTPPELRVFTSTGEHLASFGGAGEGPGEFRAIAWAKMVTADTLVVYDPWQARVSFLSLDSGYVRSTRIGDPGASPGMSLALIEPLPDGTFLGRPNRFVPREASGTGRADAAMMRVSPTGVILDTIIVFPDAAYGPRDGGPEATALLFGARAAIGYDDGRLFVGDGAAFRVTEYALDGQRLRVFERTFEPRPVTDADVNAARQIELDAAPAEMHARIEERYRQAAHAEHMPAQGRRILLDATGHLWVEEYTPAHELTSSWSVFDPEARYLGTVVMPAAFRLLQVGEDFVLGVHRNDLGVEFVRVYDLHKPQATAGDSRSMRSAAAH